MSNPSDLERRLRATLTEHADRAPAGHGLDQQILAAVRSAPSPDGRRRGWATWTMPLLAAAAVAAIVGGVFLVVSQVRPSAAPQPGALNSGTHSAATSSPHSSPATTPQSTAASQGTSPATSSPSRSTPVNAVGLPKFAATDFTFYDTNLAWAIGTADCLDGSPGRCPAMARSVDGGHHWHSMLQPPGNVTGIRFATPQIGYAFSATKFEMTTNGGASWTAQTGGAVALETLHGNVVRLVASSPSGCPGPCGVRAEYAAVGGSTWTTSDLGPINLGSARLVRSDADVYVLATRNWAGGAPAQSTLYASTDNGAHWSQHSEPCPQVGGEVDSHDIAASPGGVLTALCVPRADRPAFVALSTDAGNHFTRQSGTLPWSDAGTISGDPRTVLVAAGTHSYRSTDGGASWQPVAGVTGAASFAGFESQTLGRIVTNGGRTIWTTTDGGAHWTPFTFPP